MALDLLFRTADEAAIDDSLRARPTAPGRLPATARLGTVVILRKEDGSSQRVRRDADGVARGADAAVARAASSSGAPLPEDVRSQFERSLGVDLSSVQVHTGAESAAAATAVGAKAYTVGNDIHFAAGNYAPTDPFGLHLLAHEVAHTQQQAGTSPARQNKLEVSAPGDAAEIEADGAADAMVRAQPFAVSAVAPSDRFLREHDHDSNLDKAGDQGGAQAQAMPPDRVMSVTTIDDRGSAEAVLEYIEAQDAGMVVGAGAGCYPSLESDNVPVLPFASANEQAKVKLHQYIDSLSGLDLGLSNFQLLYQRVNIEFARLQSMAKSTGVTIEVGTNPAAGDHDLPGSGDQKSGQDAANAQVAAAGGKSIDDMAARIAKVEEFDPTLRPTLKALQDDKAALVPQAQEVADAEKNSTSAITMLHGTNDQFEGIGAQIKSQDLRRQYNTALDKVNSNRAVIDGVAQLLVGITAAIMADPHEGIKDAVGKVAETVASKTSALLALAGFPGMDLSDSDKQKGGSSDIEADKALMQQYAGLQTTMVAQANNAVTTLQGFVNKVQLLDQKEREHQEQLVTLGTRIDAAEARMQGRQRKPGQMGQFETITTFLAEADTFIADAHAAQAVGKQELDQGQEGSTAQQAKTDKDAVNSVSFYRASVGYHNTWFHGEQPRVNIAGPISIAIGGKGGSGSMDDASWRQGALEAGITNDIHSGQGGAATFDEAIANIDGLITEISTYRQGLAKALESG